jgi:hypothetical protein
MLPSSCNAKRTLFWGSRKESGVLRYSQRCAVPKICLGVYIIISMLQLDSIVIQKKMNKSIWRWRQPCLEPCASVLPPYCTVNKLGLRERPGRRDSKAAEIGRPWGTEGPEGADHPSVVVWPPGVPDGDQNHPHDPAVSRTETLSSTPTHSRIRHSGKRQLRGRRRKERDIIGKFTHVAPCVPLRRPTFCLASFWVLCHGVNTNDPPSTKMINTPHIFGCGSMMSTMSCWSNNSKFLDTSMNSHISLGMSAISNLKGQCV